MTILCLLDQSQDSSKCGNPVSAEYSNAKANFLMSLVEDFESGKISGKKISKASNHEAAKMLMKLKGIGDWCAGGFL